MVLGGVVGLERELSGKPAGLRTNILICLGSALVMDLSTRISVDADGSRIGDPARLAAQVVSGIGFLGAGTILQARGAIVGLTTAATLWTVMAIGLTVGAGQWVEAVGATALVTVVLVGLARVERWMHALRRSVTGTVRASLDFQYGELAELLTAYGIGVKSREVLDSRTERIIELEVRGSRRQVERLTAELLTHPGVHDVRFGNGTT